MNGDGQSKARTDRLRHVVFWSLIGTGILASAVNAAMSMEGVRALDRIRSYARIVRQQTSGGQNMVFTQSYTAADGATVTVVTEQGVNPPGGGLVPEDTGDLSQETGQQATDRHRARLQKSKEITGVQ